MTQPAQNGGQTPPSMPAIQSGATHPAVNAGQTPPSMPANQSGATQPAQGMGFNVQDMPGGGMGMDRTASGESLTFFLEKAAVTHMGSAASVSDIAVGSLLTITFDSNANVTQAVIFGGGQGPNAAPNQQKNTLPGDHPRRPSAMAPCP